MVTEKLVLNIEKRISAWVAIQERLKKESRREPKPTITISRQYGCEGYPLAEALKAILEKKTGDQLDDIRQVSDRENQPRDAPFRTIADHLRGRLQSL